MPVRVARQSGARSLSNIAVRDEAKDVRLDARPQAWKNRRCIRWNPLRIFSGRERRRCQQIICRSRMALLERTPRGCSPSRSMPKCRPGRNTRSPPRVRNCSRSLSSSRAWTRRSDWPNPARQRTPRRGAAEHNPHHSRRLLLQPPIRRCDKPVGGRARRSVGQHTVSSMPPSLTAPRARLAWRLGGFVTNPRE